MPASRKRIGAAGVAVHHSTDTSHDEDGNGSRAFHSPRLSPAMTPRTVCDEVEKPLISHFFRRQTSLLVGLAGCTGTGTASGLRPSLDGDAAGGNSGLSSARSTAADDTGAAAGPATPAPPPYPAPTDEAIDLFPLTPSVTVSLRQSKRSGRVLNESETLQEKHGREYRFLVPQLAYAIECVTKAHEVLRQRYSVPAHVSRPTSPVTDAESAHRDSNGGGSSTSGSTAGNTTTNSGAANAVLPSPLAELNHFSTRDVPAISVHDYLKRVVKYTYVSPSVLVCACFYLDRLLCMYPSMLLHPYNVFKLLLTSARMASKLLDTRTLNNHDFSVVGGVTNEDLNALEFFMVDLLHNHLYISKEAFDEYCRPLRLQAAHMSEDPSAWEAEAALEAPVENRYGAQHPPTRPSFVRGVQGSSRSRRSSIVSQNEYSMSTASQSGVSPLRSASRPAFPPSASTARSISVDTESLGPARGPASRCGSASTSARRYPLGTSYAAALPQMPHAVPNGVGAGAAGGGATGLRTSGGDDMLRAATHSSGIYQSGAGGAWTSQVTAEGDAEPAGLPSTEDKTEERARSIPLSAPRGAAAAASWDATGRTNRIMGASASPAVGPVVGTPNGTRGGSPKTVGTVFTTGMTGSSSSAIGSMNLAKTTTSVELMAPTTASYSGDRTPTRQAFPFAGRESVALPPVSRSGRRERSGSMIGASGPTQRVPPPPEQPRA